MNFPMIMHRTLTVFGVGHANDEVNILIENNPIYSCNSMFSMADYSTDSQLPLYSCNVPPNNNNQIVYYNWMLAHNLHQRYLDVRVKIDQTIDKAVFVMDYALQVCML